MAKPLLGLKAVYPIIPSVESERESETPSMTVLSKLNVVGIGRDEPETKKVNSLLTRHLACQAQEAQRQQRLGGLLMENDGITVTHVPFREGGSELGWSQQYSEPEINRTMEEDGSPGSDGQIPDGYGRDGFGRGGGDYDGGRKGEREAMVAAGGGGGGDDC